MTENNDNAGSDVKDKKDKKPDMTNGPFKRYKYATG